jgi:hypothetical protein
MARARTSWLAGAIAVVVSGFGACAEATRTPEAATTPITERPSAAAAEASTTRPASSPAGSPDAAVADAATAAPSPPIQLAPPHSCAEAAQAIEHYEHDHRIQAGEREGAAAQAAKRAATIITRRCTDDAWSLTVVTCYLGWYDDHTRAPCHVDLTAAQQASLRAAAGPARSPAISSLFAF